MCNWNSKRRGKRMRGTEKNIWRNNGQKFWKLKNKNKPIGLWSWMNPKHKKHEENHSKASQQKQLKLEKRVIFLKYWKKKTKPKNLSTHISTPPRTQKNIFRYPKPEIVHHHQTCFAKNTKKKLFKTVG